MATLDLTSSIQSRYGTSWGWNGWTTYNVNNNDYARFYLGQSSSLGNTRFQLKVTIPADTVISSTQKLVVAWKADSEITPKYIRGFLSTIDFGANTDLWYASDILEVSNLYLDDSKGSRFTSYYASPPWGYFVFDNVNIAAGTTYYISVASYGSDIGENTNSIGSNSGSGVWCRSRNMSGYVSATLHYTSTYNIDVNMYRADEDKWYYSGDGINKFHADIGGKRVATNASDLGYAAAPGTSYSITPVTATGYTYTGIQGGSAVSGTYPSNDFSVNLRFARNRVSRLYHPNQGLVTNTSYTQNQYGWIMKDGTYEFDKLYYGESYDCYNASTFGLIRPGYSFAGWLLDSNGGGAPSTGVYKIFDETTAYASTEFHKIYDANTTTATVGAGNFISYLSAQWTPNNYTINFDSSGGSAVSSQTVAYGNGNYTSLPTPTSTGKKFAGWYADIGTDGPINLGCDYKYPSSSGVGLTFEAYKDDWSTVGTETLISCTNGGGWNLWFNNGVLISEVYDTGLGGYQTLTICNASDLTPGWHKFTMSIHTVDGIFIDVDGVHTFRGPLSSSLGYFEKNCLWLGGEASNETTYHDGLQFSGLIKNFVIRNQYTNLTHSAGFAIPAQNITLYADWEPCDYMYVKVNNTWKLGRVIYKENGEWLLPSGVESPDIRCTVTQPPGASYGFAKNSKGYWESQNKGIANSAAVGVVNFTLTKTTTVIVECINSGEANFDFGIISNLGTSLGTTYTVDTTNVKHSFKGSSSTSIQTVSFGALAAGTYGFYIKFRKDSSINSGNDSLQFTLVKG